MYNIYIYAQTLKYLRENDTELIQVLKYANRHILYIRWYSISA